MDKIDSFIIHANGKGVEFTFVIVEEDIPKEERANIVDYIDNLTRELNTNCPELTFTWQEAHRVNPLHLSQEIRYQIFIQTQYKGWFNSNIKN